MPSRFALDALTPSNPDPPSGVTLPSVSTMVLLLTVQASVTKLTLQAIAESLMRDSARTPRARVERAFVYVGS
mgnify:FL=1